MKKGLLYYRIPNQTPDWYKFRTVGLTEDEASVYKMSAYEGGIGGSEIPSILNATSDTYRHPAWLYNLKVGRIQYEDIDNENKFWGRLDEDNIAKIWQYCNQADAGYVDNFNNENIRRTCRRVNAYIINPKYIWLFASLDRVIDKGMPRLDTNEPLKDGGILEIKHLNEFIINKFEDKIPIDYKLQVLQYLLVTGFDYAEFAIRSGKMLRIYIIEYDKEMCDAIAEISHGFWYNRVLPARKILAEIQDLIVRNKYEEAEKLTATFHKLEPEPDGSNAYKTFMKEIYQRDIVKVIGTEKDKNNAKLYKYYSEVVKSAEAQKQTFGNLLINSHYLEKAEYLTFGEEKEYSRYYEDSRGIKKLDVKLPYYEIDREKIDQSIAEL